MTVTTGTPISISDIKSGTGSSANDLGSYYRGNSTNYGWTPASGAISFNDLRGAWARSDVNGTHDGYGTYPYYPHTLYTSYGGYYYYYYSLSGNAYYRGDIWYTGTGPYNESSYPGGGRTAVRACVTGNWATLPMGAIGDTGGVERFVGAGAYCSISGWFVYYNKKSIEMIAHQSGIGIDTQGWGTYGWVSGSVWDWVNYHNSQNNGYAFGVRIDTGGTAYVGKYYIGNFGSSSAPSSITVAEETSITGSSYAYGRHRQTHLGGGAATEITGGVTFRFYTNNVYAKNAYTARSFNSLSLYGGEAFRSTGNTGWT